MNIAGLAVLGIVAGMLSGLIGIGGGVVVVPALVLLFGYSQQSAQGTTLAMLVPPVGILAAYAYYKAGYADIKAAAVLAAAFLIGALAGAYAAIPVKPEILQRIFGFVLLLISVRMIFFK